MCSQQAHDTQASAACPRLVPLDISGLSRMGYLEGQHLRCTYLERSEEARIHVSL